MIKKVFKIFGLTLILCTVCIKSSGQNIATVDNITSSALIITPISISYDGTYLNFGSIVSLNSGSYSVTLSSEGVRTTDNENSIVSAFNESSVPSFTVYGQEDWTYKVTFENVTTLVGPTGSTPMTLDSFTTTLGVTNRGILTTGENTFSVGATLHLSSGQTPGEYIGSFSVIVAYE